jgi:hypothetical protein
MRVLSKIARDFNFAVCYKIHRIVEVWLSKPTSQVKGHTWPLYDNGKPLEVAAIETPTDMVIYLPSGREVRLYAKAVTFRQENGLVTRVSPLPLPDLKEFPKAVEEAKRIAADLKIPQNSRITTDLGRWQNQKPTVNSFGSVSTGDYITRDDIEKDLLLEITLKIHPSSKEWMIVLDFIKTA